MLKAAVADVIETSLKDGGLENIGERQEVQRVSPLVIQVKVWEANGAPRYLNVHVKELL